MAGHKRQKSISKQKTKTSISHYQVFNVPGDRIALTEQTLFGATTVTMRRSDVRRVASLLLGIAKRQEQEDDIHLGS